MRLQHFAFFLLTSLFGPLLVADEGMWLFENFPRAAAEAKYRTKLDDSLLTHLRSGAVRFNNGGTGSFVSPSGLLFTNHHVGSDCIQKLGSKDADYLKTGFYAAKPADEKPCPDLEVNVLLKTEDVTTKVNASLDAKASPAEANQKRKAAMTQLEKACTSETGNRCDVVTLFSGGQYHLYQYKKYTDIRLVFAPEFGIAFFGGDPDNFTYPRFCLDIAFFRAYENGQPAAIKNYFRWSSEGVKDGEMILVPGNPGTTGRLATTPELKFNAELAYPMTERRLASLIAALQNFMNASEENRRIAQENLFSQQNSYKAYQGFLRGLRDPKLMAKKREDEARLRAYMAKDPAKREEFARFWDSLETSYAEYRKYYKPFTLFERQAIRGSELFSIARDIIRYSAETAKPNEARLREFADSALPSLEQAMYSEAPIHPALETVVIQNYLEFLVQELGATEPTVAKILNGRTPKAAAEHYVQSSKLADVAERKRLVKDRSLLEASKDGLIELARILDRPARDLRKQYEDHIESVITSSAATIAKARYAMSGGNEYPDATFTLRLAYGQVRGYKNDQGQNVPYGTTLAGLFERGKPTDPYIVPPTWLAAKDKLRLNTIFNFVATADTHGGNSGSATLNAKGEVIGILFDGNLEGLPSRFVYDDVQSRSVHVASQGIIEALDKVYRTDRVLKELGVTSK